MKSMIWTWAENMLRNEVGGKYINPQNGKKDVNQNNIMNVNIGVDSTWKMDHLLDIAKDLKKKKMYMKKEKLYAKDYTDDKDSLQETAKDKMNVLLEEDKSRQVQPVMAFIQF